MKIHTTAIVEPGAVLADDVEIGAYALVSGDVVIGAATVVQAHAVITGAVRIGSENVIGYGAVIGAEPQDLTFKPATRSGVVIGDRNIIREHCTIHRGTADGSDTVVGDGNFLMVGVHLGHNCRLGNDIIIANSCLLAGYVQIDDRAFLSGGARFHQSVRIGRLTFVEGRFRKNLPPFVSAAENAVYSINVVGLRRAGFTAEQRDEIKCAFKLLYRSGLNTRQALAAAADASFSDVGREFFEFVTAAGSRGIVPSGNVADIEDLT
ncbi:MAG: acyl-ACP--UDP-N-acetylglucosamine O-acyltransferase [Verrucomicrobiota bacterium]|nr:acyl-ACP--UDP-N-acetylglucosamine O-acyltransferase [Verrucomicrobiota bacterium]